MKYNQEATPLIMLARYERQTITVISTSFNQIVLEDAMLYTKINDVNMVVVGLF